MDIGGKNMTFHKSFWKLNRIVQLLLLIIPFVNWITEILVRWSYFLEKKDVLSLVMALLATFFFGIILGIIDFVCVLLSKHLFLC